MNATIDDTIETNFRLKDSEGMSTVVGYNQKKSPVLLDKGEKLDYVYKLNSFKLALFVMSVQR